MEDCMRPYINTTSILLIEITSLYNTYEVYVGFCDIIIKVVHRGDGTSHIIMRHLQAILLILVVFLQSLRKILYQ